MSEVECAAMPILATILDGEKRLATSRYEPGFLVENKIVRTHVKTEINLKIVDGMPRTLNGKWPDALDEYFNSWSFRTDSSLIPGETERSGCANEHRSLFLTAVRLLEKALESKGMKVEVEFF